MDRRLRVGARAFDREDLVLEIRRTFRVNTNPVTETYPVASCLVGRREINMIGERLPVFVF